MSRASRDPSVAAAADALRPVVSQVVTRTGFVLDDLQVRPVGQRLLVRVIVDTAQVPGPTDGPAGGVDLDAVAAVSRDVSAAVDAHEESAGAVLDQPWTLEVSTPGTDRPLTRPHHWRRAWLRRVAVTLTDGSEVTGRVGGVTPESADGAGPTDGTGSPDGTGPADDTAPDDDVAGSTVTLLVDGGLRRTALDEVARAVVEVEFKPAPAVEVELLRTARAATGPAEETP